MAIITTIEDVKRYLRISNVSEEASLPNMDRYGRRFLKPILGDVYQQLDDAYNENNTEGYDADLLELSRAALVPLAYWSELGYNAAALTDAGIRQQVSDGMQSAYRWQYMELKEALQDQGMEAIDELWQWLYENGSLVGWTEPVVSKTIFKTGAEFALYYPIAQPARVYATLRPFIQEVLQSYVYPTVGSTTVDALVAGGYTEGVGYEALELMKKAVANLTIKQAISRAPCRVTPQGFTVLMGFTSTTDYPHSGTQAGTDNQLAMMHDSCELTGQNMLAKMKAWMDANVDDPHLETYKNSGYYVAPADQPSTDYNSDRKGVYGF